MHFTRLTPWLWPKNPQIHVHISVRLPRFQLLVHFVLVTDILGFWSQLDLIQSRSALELEFCGPQDSSCGSQDGSGAVSVSAALGYLKLQQKAVLASDLIFSFFLSIFRCYIAERRRAKTLAVVWRHRSPALVGGTISSRIGLPSLSLLVSCIFSFICFSVFPSPWASNL